VVPVDPNDIVGPEGFGLEHWVGTEERLPYIIHFENAPTATAPAQQVTITETLDADLDPRTFRLGDFGWGALTFHVPDNRAFYSHRFDFAETLGFYVDVVAGIDVTNGQAFWTLTTIDPDTGEIPLDASIGFLAVNDSNHIGEGFVTYTVSAQNTAATGSRVEAIARIVFDTEEPMDTPTVFNTLDAVSPTSEVDILPAISAVTTFTVRWSGDDDADGSALRDYTIYVSDNGAAYERWLADTTLTEAEFTGQAGHSYAFYSVASDNVGNVEASPGAYDTQTRLSGGVPAPMVENVLVKSTDWNSNFLTYLRSLSEQNVDGYSIPVGNGAQLLPVPWKHINQIQVVFSEDVWVDKDDLMLSGVNVSMYDLDDWAFAYHSETHTAMWTMPSSTTILADKLLLQLNADGADPIRNHDDIALDGEWTNPTATTDTGTSTYLSGNGTAGGNFLFRFNLLLGDVNQDGLIKTMDALAVLPNLNKAVTDTAYNPRYDIDGNGQIKTTDILAILPRLNRGLPAGEPVEGTFSTAMLLAESRIASNDNVVLQESNDNVGGPNLLVSAKSLAISASTTISSDASEFQRQPLGTSDGSATSPAPSRSNDLRGEFPYYMLLDMERPDRANRPTSGSELSFADARPVAAELLKPTIQRKPQVVDRAVLWMVNELDADPTVESSASCIAHQRWNDVSSELSVSVFDEEDDWISDVEFA
jgi:hypothetical protein